MKTLKDFINRSLEVFDNISESIYEYCLLRFKEDNIYIPFDDDYITEGTSGYKGCRELAEYIIDKTKNSDNNISIENIPVEFENVYMKNIYVYRIKDKYQSVGYRLKENEEIDKFSKWNNEEKCFNYIEIYIYGDIKDYKSLRGDIMHELEHGYKDYISFLKNGKHLYDRLMKINKYDEITKIDSSDNQYLKNIKLINYYIIKDETEGILSELDGYLDDKYYSFADALKDLKKSYTYDSICKVYNNIQYILSTNDIQDDFCDEWRKFFNINKSNKNIFDKLEKQTNKFWTYFSNHIYHILLDHSYIIETTSPSSNRLLIEDLRKK